MEGKIIRIEQDYAQPGNRPGIIVTVRIPQPQHPGEVWVGFDYHWENPEKNTDPKIRALVEREMSRYRAEQDEYHGFHVGFVEMTMPQVR